MRKLLFVCRENVGRSQIAMAYYNDSHRDKAESAGIIVDKPGEKLKDNKYAGRVIKTMLKDNIDISNSARSKLAEEKVADYEKIIVLAEPEVVPAWLQNLSQVEFWETKDLKYLDFPEVKKICLKIKSKVSNL